MMAAMNQIIVREFPIEDWAGDIWDNVIASTWLTGITVMPSRLRPG